MLAVVESGDRGDKQVLLVTSSSSKRQCRDKAAAQSRGPANSGSQATEGMSGFGER